MKEKGIITKIISGNVVEVAFSKSSACAGCRACHDVGQNTVGVEAINEIGAKVQDLVEVEIPTDEVVKSSMVVYLLPVFFLIVGYLIGTAIVRLTGFENMTEMYGVIFAIVFLIASFFVVRWYDENIESKVALVARVIKKI